MNPDELTHCFERLWHGDTPGHGSGLGLWIAKTLVEAHGGRIVAPREYGRGTMVSIFLPLPRPEDAKREALGHLAEART
jgi:signal transduction histidine kinase